MKQKATLGMKRALILLMVLATVSSLSFAQGAKESTSVATGPVSMTIATWTSNADQIALLGSFVQGFAKEKGIEINANFESIPFAEYNTKLPLELQGSDGPDVFWILETAAPAYIQSGLLAKLNDAMTPYDPSDLSSDAMALWTKGGNVYAIPFSTSPFFMLYNADLFAKAGAKNPDQLIAEGNWTWDAFRAASKQIKDNTGVWAFQTVDGQGYDARILHNLSPIVRSFGGDFWTEDGKIMVNAPQTVKAVQFFHDMVYVDQSVVPPGNQSDFYAGNAAMTVGQISRVSKLNDASFAWGLAPMPSGPNGNAPVIGQAAIGASARSKNAKLASELVAYMTNKASVTAMSGIWPPARKSVLDSEAFLSSNAKVTPMQMKTAVADSIKTGRVLPSHVKYPQIEVESKMSFDKLWNSDANVQAIMDEVAVVYAKYIK
ncbi:ABC-type sugar transport system, periplasmic component [Sphaerochaeta pleomorpha str. Grapes]|uniref:ABC-type sugar transport system, periplasmic component n=1 Tax=Sphaerochaeta pleomorpha (strain ATCC BAA-1885 / DSM 22778 / Grapes) TaxID=158190 RepID=G8QVQ3_SPHPG|nr:sugar ABC transporter substrate-binding protein [Sphaerochaeta pleomorpha]AEV29345.1 ABC-type sugar transport system, periplasmic component [Sphaerochaeta pleomorpha str. Grapes]